jgi:hypothetical protein
MIFDLYREIDCISYDLVFTIITSLYSCKFQQLHQTDLEYLTYFLRDVDINKRIFSTTLIYQCFDMIFII